MLNGPAVYPPPELRPVPIRAHLDRHEGRTASQEGWGTLKNGDLLTAAEAAGFDVLLSNFPPNVKFSGHQTIKAD
jgi:hypothetical protein